METLVTATLALGGVRVHAFSRSESQKKNVPFMILTLPEVFISAM